MHMLDMLRRLVWFGIVSTTFAYAFLLIAGSVVSAQAARLYDPVILRDELSPGAHHLSGMVMVPSRCDQLTLHTEMLSTTTYALLFTTWREPSVTCEEEEVPRAFREVVFAPAANVRFVASLDGKPFSVVVIPVLPARMSDP